MFEYICLVCCLCIMLIIVLFFTSGSSCIRDDTKYPELHLFRKFNKIIVKELDNAIKTRRWTNIFTVDTLVKTQFSIDPLNSQQIIQIIENTYEPLTTNLYSLKLFVLIYFNIVIEDNVRVCPNITALLNGVPNVMNAYIQSVTPHTVTDKRSGAIKDNTIRCMIPLTPYDGREGISINDEVYNYSDLLATRDYIVFNTKCFYQLWNLTDVNKYVLVLDILDL